MKNNLLLLALLLLLNISLSMAQIPRNGLVAHYLFNADAQDESGNLNHGYVFGGVFPDKDRFNNECGAMKFNGSDGYIRVPHSKSLGQPQTAYSVALWFKALDGSEYSDLQWMTICCKSDINEENSSSPQFRLQSTRYTVSMNTDFTENFDHKIDFDTWYHYVVTYDGIYCRVYLNNKEIVNWVYTTKFEPNQLAMEIGRDLPGKIEYFCGVMDDLYIYDRALSAKEIADIYANQSEKTSKKPCSFNTPIIANNNANTNNNTNSNPNPNPNAKTNNNVILKKNTVIQNNSVISTPEITESTCSNHPLFVDGDTIEYQQTVEVENPNVQLLFYDAEKEDGDIVSINFNGAWVLEKYYLKKKLTQAPHTINLSLIPNFENYIFTKAWNLGSIPPNTLTVEIVDPKSSKPNRVINITSKIGRSGAIKLVYKP